MAAILPDIPEPKEIDEFVEHLAHAVSFVEQLRPSMELQFETELAAVRDGEEVPQHFLTLPEIGTLFLVVTEAREAAEALKRYADDLLVGIPELVNRDHGYAAAYGSGTYGYDEPGDEGASD